MHRRGYALSLAYLFLVDYASVENFKDQDRKPICIGSRYRIMFDSVPSGFFHFRREISVRIGKKSSIILELSANCKTKHS